MYSMLPSSECGYTIPKPSGSSSESVSPLTLLPHTVPDLYALSKVLFYIAKALDPLLF